MRICVLLQGKPGLADKDPMVRNALHTKDAILAVLRGAGAEATDVLLDDGLEFVSVIRSAGADLVFNVCDLGLSYRPELEPHVAAILEAMSVPFTGSGVFALGLTNDKALSKEILSRYGVRTPREHVVDPSCHRVGDESCGISAPVICKPLLKHNSVDITFDSVVYDDTELDHRIEEIEETGEPFVLEEFIDGRELIAAFMGNGSKRKMLPVEEIVFGEYFDDKPHILTYDAKWYENDPSCAQSRPEIPAPISESVRREVADAVSEIARILHVLDYGRVDFRLAPDGRIYAIDVNANPDVSPDAGLFKMARADGMSYGQFICGIVDSALDRRAGR